MAIVQSNNFTTLFILSREQFPEEAKLDVRFPSHGAEPPIFYMLTVLRRLGLSELVSWGQIWMRWPRRIRPAVYRSSRAGEWPMRGTINV
jgi:hypothetical protein